LCFCGSSGAPILKHYRIIKSALWRESVVEKLLWWFWKGLMCWNSYFSICVLFCFQYNVAYKINVTGRMQVGSWWKWRISICDLKHTWIILGWISRRWGVGVWTELGWSRIGFREMRGISWLATNQLASQEGLCTME